MTVRNTEIAEMFEEIADLLDIRGDNPFRIRAYRTASETVRELGIELSEMQARGEKLDSLPGIGKDLAGKISQIIRTGTTDKLEELRAQMPPGLLAMLHLPGIGPKRVKILNKELKISTVEELAAAAREGLIKGLPGFGAKMEQQILETLNAQAETGARYLRAEIVPLAERLLARLRDVPSMIKVEIAGSYRRGRETVGDLDLLAVTAAPEEAMERFVSDSSVVKVLARGVTKSSVVLRMGIQVDLRVVEEQSFGAALVYFTGSKAHNIETRKIGQQRGLKVNEYGVFEGERRLCGATEEEVYAILDLPWIPPELRENTGEIDAAREKRLPRLVETADIKGELHAHTSATDGHLTIRQLADAARERGYRYIAVTDHTRNLAMTHGLDAEQLRAQIDEIDRVNDKVRGITILKGSEVDILEDGSLDLPDDVLKRLDLVIGSVHTHFRLSIEKQTERILRAMDHQHFTILGHPSGRLLLKREPYKVDLPRIILHAKERGCFLELNANPERLDLSSVFCRLAKQEGVMVSIDTDAHWAKELDNMQHGVNEARRGWLEKKDVLNTRDLKSLRRLLEGTMG